MPEKTEYSTRRKQEFALMGKRAMVKLGWRQCELGAFMRCAQGVVSWMVNRKKEFKRSEKMRRCTMRLSCLDKALQASPLPEGLSYEEVYNLVPMPDYLRKFEDDERDADIADTLKLVRREKAVEPEQQELPFPEPTQPPAPPPTEAAQPEPAPAAAAPTPAPVEEPEADEQPVYASGALVHIVDDWQVVVNPGDEPRVLDIVLAKHLGFSRPRNIRKLIERHSEYLGDWAKRSTVERGATELSREGALYIAAKCETPVGNEILKDIVRVYAAVSRLAAGAPPQPQDNAILQGIWGLLQKHDAQFDKIDQRFARWEAREEGTLRVIKAGPNTQSIAEQLYNRYGKAGLLHTSPKWAYRPLTNNQLLLLASRAGVKVEELRVSTERGPDKNVLDWKAPAVVAVAYQVECWYFLGCPKMTGCAWHYNPDGVGQSRFATCYDWDDDSLIPRLYGLGYPAAHIPHALHEAHVVRPPALRDVPYVVPAIPPPGADARNG